MTDELERLAEENNCYTLESKRGFHLGLKAAEKLFKERWPSENDFTVAFDKWVLTQPKDYISAWGVATWYHNWLKQKLFGGGE
jgi:hypothetical protein